MLKMFQELKKSVLIRLSEGNTDVKVENMTKLKNHFANKIRSNRTFDRIRDFEDLFRVLEKRNELSYRKLEPLKYAATIIEDKNLLEHISKLEQQFENCENSTASDDDNQLYENGKFSSSPAAIISGKQENSCSRLEKQLSRVVEEEKKEAKYEQRRRRQQQQSYIEKHCCFTRGKTDWPPDEENSITNCAIMNECEKVMMRAERRKKWGFKLLITISIFMIVVIAFLFSTNLIPRHDFIDYSLRFPAISTPASSVMNETILPNQQINLNSSRTNLRLGTHSRGSSTSSNITENEKQKLVLVLDRISDRIGHRWRDLARYLDVREVDIDVLEGKYPADQKEKAYQMLIISQSPEYSPQEWKIRLMRALEKVRRRDLRDWLEKYY